MNKEKARFNMIEQQIRPWGIHQANVLDLMSSLPREVFVPDDQKSLAFADLNIQLAHNQQMFTPREEARMLQALALKHSDKALEIGTGSGFCSALIASQVNELLTIDIYPEFITAAETRFKSLNLHNIQTEVADITQDWQPNNLYDAISITAALSSPPNDYLNLLNPGGRLFCVEGKLNNQYAKLYTCQTKGKYSIQSLFEMSTPNLINESAKESFVF
ncbi:protein-L-isoaspartate O-methyltransferase family protein [Pleionea mediterranea]|uniref:Protein-L-isoaspartate O-methyltransferase n=1 Tax=Pleionea mediterranea TaxID=523701 RepID=A0A316FT55_9GAMM|nr:protein-L-isoaspartate O-methyltransferase [Pleionea mediterranea]PWK51918.1 protein-L-isoaspartate(D-aspartate) O-methyltransferase [Pleionea mediterranea]